MNILIPVVGFSAAGGMRVLAKLADSFIEKGHCVEFVAPKGAAAPYFPSSANVRYYPSLFFNIPILGLIFSMLGMVIALIYSRRSTDIFLANANLTAYPVFIASLFSKKGFYYIQAYEPDFSEGRSKFLTKTDQTIAKLSYKLPLIRIVNAALYKNYKEITAEHVVEPGIDLFNFFNKDLLPNFKMTFVVGCIGRKELWKGTGQIITAIRELRLENGIDIRLRVAFHYPEGFDGEEYDFIEKVQPHGDVNLAAFYRSTDIFCATGLIQTGAFHYPCMEAMASGVPVVSNYSPADEKCAIWIDEVSSDVLKKSILEIYSMSTERLQTMLNVAEKKTSLFSWDVISNKMLHIFLISK